ncbi:MAG: glycosyltransferase, partial [Planctomycetota bacterium]
LPMALWSCVLGVPTVYEAHSPVNSRDRYARLMWTSIAKRNSFRALVVISRSLAARFIKDCIREHKKLIVAPDAARRTSRVTAHLPQPITKARLRAVYMGHLFSGKGLELVCALTHRCPWLDFHIYGGPGHRIPALAALANPANCHFHGEIPHAQVAHTLALADIALLPNEPQSHGHGENEDIGAYTSPLKLFEYMAIGLPVVASGLPVLREVLTDNVNALLCPWNDPKAWESALERLRDPQLRQRLGNGGRRCIEEIHNWQYRTRRIIASATLKN